jgi:uncharacterized membrane protein YeiB
VNASQYKITNITEFSNLAVHHLMNFAVLFGLGMLLVVMLTLAMKAAGWNRLAVRLGGLVTTGVVGMTVLWMMSKLLSV